MSGLADTLDKLYTEVDHLDRLLSRDEATADEVKIALAVAKRVRVQCNVLVKKLAVMRDTATSP